MEQYLNASSRDTYRAIKKMLGAPTTTDPMVVKDHIESLDPQTFEQAYQYLVGFYRIASPKINNMIVSGAICATLEDRQMLMAEVIANPAGLEIIGLNIPTDEDVYFQDIITELQESSYRPTYGPVTFKGVNGDLITTEKNVRIGSVYFMVLEKTGDDWAAVSSPKTQHFGIIAQLGKNDKFSHPARLQGPRIMGEAETRNVVSYVGERFTAEFMDRNNNPETHREINKQLLLSDNPSNIDNLVDRRNFKYGMAKPHQILNSMLETSGIKLAYAPYEWDKNGVGVKFK